MSQSFPLSPVFCSSCHIDKVVCFLKCQRIEPSRPPYEYKRMDSRPAENQIWKENGQRETRLSCFSHHTVSQFKDIVSLCLLPPSLAFLLLLARRSDRVAYRVVRRLRRPTGRARADGGASHTGTSRRSGCINSVH